MAPMKKLSIAIALGVGLGALVACNSQPAAASGGGAQPSATPTATPSAARVIEVKVDGSGYTPSQIDVRAKEAVTLRFRRVSDDTCAKKVVFPETKLERELPLNQPVDVPIPTDSARSLAFQCGMGMYKSSVVIN
jgi:plastocyanin domain-containing protein